VDRIGSYGEFIGISDEKYMLFTSFRRDGTPVATPVWVVPLGDREVGFWTSSQSGKAKRVRHTPGVTIQASDARGRVRHGSAPQAATARIVTGEAFEVIRSKVKAKYGFVTHLTKIAGTLIGVIKGKRVPYGDCGVIVTLS
jgi:uncharacterized protein